MKIALCQLDSAWEDRVGSRNRIKKLSEEWPTTADLFVFPEMTLSGFSMKVGASTIDEADKEFFEEFAREKRADVLFGGVDQGKNCIFHTDGGPTKMLYAKRHLFGFAGETDIYSEGIPMAILRVKDLRIGLAICYDLRFAYHFWTKAEEVDAYVVIANWPTGRKFHWCRLLEARAIENQAYVVGVNRVGSDPVLNYPGESAVYGPFGDHVVQCGSEPGIYTAELHSATVRDVRTKYPFLKDRKRDDF